MSALCSDAELPDTLESIRGAIVGVGTSYPPRQPIGQAARNQLLGTGFAVGDGLTVATNAHVLPSLLYEDNQQFLAVFTGRGAQAQVRRAEVVTIDEDHDLAILAVAGEPLPTMQLGTSVPVREGMTTAFTGFPIGAVLGLYPATHTGVIAAITPAATPVERAGQLTPEMLVRLRNRYDVYQLDAIAYPGNSGSPLYVPATGHVVGIVNSTFVKDSRESVLQTPSAISYAIPVRHLAELLGGTGPGEGS